MDAASSRSNLAKSTSNGVLQGLVKKTLNIRIKCVRNNP